MGVPGRKRHFPPLTPWYEQVSKDENGCLVWQGSRDKEGYGKTGGVMAHRRVYEIEVGPIPEGLTIDHLCFNTGCVNPRHLEAVTMEENYRRSLTRRRGPDRDPLWSTHCPAGHERTPEISYTRPPRAGRNPRIECRICDRVRRNNYRRRKGIPARNLKRNQAVAS